MGLLKPPLARGELQCIGATTVDEHRKYIEKDAALERRFQPIVVEEPSEEDTIRDSPGIKEKYEVHQRHPRRTPRWTPRWPSRTGTSPTGSSRTRPST